VIDAKRMTKKGLKEMISEEMFDECVEKFALYSILI